MLESWSGEVGRWDAPVLVFRAEGPEDCLAQAEGLGDVGFRIWIGLKARQIHRLALAGASVVEGVELESPCDVLSARSNEFRLPLVSPKG